MRMNKACSVFALSYIWTVILAQSSFGEVCDKIVGESWRAEDGLWQSWVFMIPLHIIILFGLSFLFIRKKLYKASFALSIILVLLGGTNVWSWLGPVSDYDEIWQSAIKEGCASRAFGLAAGLEFVMVGLVFLVIALLIMNKVVKVERASIESKEPS
jgi:hypothetical protein